MMMDALAVFGASLIFLILFCIALVVFAFIFWIWMIVDCVQRKFKNHSDKIIWILVLIFLQFLGAILYYFIVKHSHKV